MENRRHSYAASVCVRIALLVFCGASPSCSWADESGFYEASVSVFQHRTAFPLLGWASTLRTAGCLEANASAQWGHLILQHRLTAARLHSEPHPLAHPYMFSMKPVRISTSMSYFASASASASRWRPVLQLAPLRTATFTVSHSISTEDLLKHGPHTNATPSCVQKPEGMVLQ